MKTRVVVAVVLAVAAAGALATELVLRGRVPDWTWLSCLELKPGPDLPCMLPVAGCTGEFTGFAVPQAPIPFRISGRGFRRPEPPAGRAPTIAVFGASNVFGLGVADGATFVARLPAEIAALSGARVRTLNLGCPGHDLRQQLRHAESPWDPAPDLLVFTLSEEQLMPSDCADWSATVSSLAKGIAMVRAWKLWRGRWRQRLDPRAIEETISLAGRWRAHHPDRAAVFVVLQPLGQGAAHRARADALRRGGVPLLDLSAELAHLFESRDGRYRIENREHLNEAAHAELARRLARHLIPLLGASR